MLWMGKEAGRLDTASSQEGPLRDMQRSQERVNYNRTAAKHTK